MDATARRECIYQKIKHSEKALSASALAKQLSVSRQIIVGDVALLRASGKHIMATPRGYILEQEAGGVVKTIAVSHTPEQLEEEILTIIDLGGTMIDVIVDHPLYGELVGNLHIASRYDAQQFFDNLKNNQAVPLSRLTNGLHLHTIECKDEESYQRILLTLQQKGLLWEAEH